MRVIPPLSITDAMFTSSTAAEPGVGEQTYNSATSYAIGDQVILGSPSSTVTISIASPGVVTWSNNGLPNGTPVVLTTTGTLPTGLTAGRIYYVVKRAAGSFQLSEEVDGASIVTTGSQSGTHTATAQIHRKYESVTASNTGNRPAIDDGTNWIDIGPTNKWAALDLLRNTATYGDSPLTFVITPGERIDSIGLIGIRADSVDIDVSVGGNSVYTYTENLSTRDTASWYDYFFLPFTYKTAVALFDVPPSTGAVVTVTLTRATGYAALGGLILGMNVYIGETVQDPVDEALNFSSVDRDVFGNATLVRRRSVPATQQTVICEKSNVNKVRALREALDAVPALWSGLDDADHGYFEAVLILGIHNRFAINLSHPNHAVISLELQEI